MIEIGILQDQSCEFSPKLPTFNDLEFIASSSLILTDGIFK